MIPALKKKPAESRPDMKPLKILALGAFFDQKTGTWVSDDNQAIKHSESLLIQELEKEKMLNGKLEEGLAKKLIYLDIVKKEIRMTLNDHQKNLTSQGFKTEELLEKFPENN